MGIEPLSMALASWAGLSNRESSAYRHVAYAASLLRSLDRTPMTTPTEACPARAPAAARPVLTTRGRAPAIPLSSRQAEVLCTAFVTTVTTLNTANGDSDAWWLTWLSTRDRFRPQLWNRMVTLARLDAARRAGAEGAAAVADPPTARVALDMLGASASFGDRLRWHLGTLRQGLANAVMLAKHAGLALRRLDAARRHPAGGLAEPVDTLIVTILMERAVANDGPYEDVYFGGLHRALAAAGQRSLHVGFTEGDAGRIAAAAIARRDVRIATFAHLLHHRDVAAALAAALTARFRIPPLPLPWGGDAGPLIRADLRRERASVFEGRLIERAMERLLARHPAARVIHMYENNGWERAAYLAARRAAPRRSVTGYLHCSVLRSHLKNHFPGAEHGIRPMPDRVVTTGPAARDLLATLGTYPPALVVPGCGLRPPLLSKLERHEPPVRPMRTVLALFEGLVSVAPALVLYARAAERRPDLRFLVRCHPQLPIERLGPIAGVPYGEAHPVKVSRPPALDAAIAEADAVVYVSSTAVLYALYAGRPIVKLDIDDTVDDDPLTACPSLKWRAATADDLQRALAAIDALDDDACRRATVSARTYLERYLAEPDPETLAPLLTPPPPGGGWR